MYICCDCGRILDEDEVRTRSECVGEFWGAPAYMDVIICPGCGSDDLDDYEEDPEEDDDEEA